MINVVSIHRIIVISYSEVSDTNVSNRMTDNCDSLKNIFLIFLYLLTKKTIIKSYLSDRIVRFSFHFICSKGILY